MGLLPVKASSCPTSDPHTHGQEHEALCLRIWHTHTCRYLKAWDTEDAAKEFMAWGTFQQVCVPVCVCDAHCADALSGRAEHTIADAANTPQPTPHAS